MTVDQLLLLANTYAAHRGLALATVSTYAATDGKFFRRLSEGAGCTIAKADRITGWFDVNWPSDLDWPSSISRPSEASTVRRKRRAA